MNKPRPSWKPQRVNRHRAGGPPLQQWDRAGCFGAFAAGGLSLGAVLAAAAALAHHLAA